MNDVTPLHTWETRHFGSEYIQFADEMEAWAQQMSALPIRKPSPPTDQHRLLEAIAVYNADLRELEFLDAELAATNLSAGGQQRLVGQFALVMHWAVRLQNCIRTSPVFYHAEWYGGEFTSAQKRLADVGATNLRFIHRYAP